MQIQSSKHVHISDPFCLTGIPLGWNVYNITPVDLQGVLLRRQYRVSLKRRVQHSELSYNQIIRSANESFIWFIHRRRVILNEGVVKVTAV